jgi:hypothetical protein
MPLVLDEGEKGQALCLARLYSLALRSLCQAIDDPQRQVIHRLLALEKGMHAIAIGNRIGIAAYDQRLLLLSI